MIVIDRRDDPLFVIRIEGAMTAEDLYVYRHLCEELNIRQCVYATVWIEETETPPCLHTQAESRVQAVRSQTSLWPFASLTRLWQAALARIRMAAA